MDRVDMLGKLDFKVCFQGLLRCRHVICYQCAEGLGVGEPDSHETIEWHDSPITGARLVRVQVHNKGSEYAEYNCPICGGYLETKCGAECSFLVSHIEKHEQTFAEVCDSLETSTDSLEIAVEQEDHGYAEYLRESIAELDNKRALMLL